MIYVTHLPTYQADPAGSGTAICLGFRACEEVAGTELGVQERWLGDRPRPRSCQRHANLDPLAARGTSGGQFSRAVDSSPSLVAFRRRPRSDRSAARLHEQHVSLGYRSRAPARARCDGVRVDALRGVGPSVRVGGWCTNSRSRSTGENHLVGVGVGVGALVGAVSSGAVPSSVNVSS